MKKIIESLLDDTSHYYVMGEKTNEMTVDGVKRPSKYHRIDSSLNNEVIKEHLSGDTVVAQILVSNGKIRQFVFDHDTRYGLTSLLEKFQSIEDEVTIVPSKTIGRVHIHKRCEEISIKNAYVQMVALSKKLGIRTDMKPFYGKGFTDDAFQIMTLPFYNYEQNKKWYDLFVGYSSVEELIQRIKDFGYKEMVLQNKKTGQIWKL